MSSDPNKDVETTHEAAAEQANEAVSESSKVCSVCPQSRFGQFLCALVLLSVIVVVIVVPIVLTRDDPKNAMVQSSGGRPISTMQTIQNRGYLKCGIYTNAIGRSKQNPLTDKWEGLNADLCRAIAAGMFGDKEAVEFVVVNGVTRFPTLVDGGVDVLSSTDTHTLQRDIAEPSTGVGLTFSRPYIYGGMVFAGVPPHVQCANTRNETCQADLTVCLLQGTTFVQLTKQLLPQATLVELPDQDSCYRDLGVGSNIVAGDQFEMSELLVRTAGYSGPYRVGDQVYSKEPLALVTREEDPTWSDFCNWVLQCLFLAEKMGISQQDGATFLDETHVFGDDYKHVFQRVVSAVGNYGDLYARHMEPLVFRRSLNLLNDGTSGLMYSMPFGDLSTDGPGTTPGGTLERIAARGKLLCGVTDVPYFSQQRDEDGGWSGMNVDLCRAIAASIFFGGISSTVDFVELSEDEAEQLKALQDGTVDVLATNLVETLQLDVNASGKGLSFSPPVFYNGLSFGGLPEYSDCANARPFNMTACPDLVLCKVADTPLFDKDINQRFKIVMTKPNYESMVQAFVDGDCPVMAGTAIQIANATVQQAASGGTTLPPYQAGSDRFSSVPLALATTQTDPQWSGFVYGIISALIYADEQQDMDDASGMPTMQLFGKRYVESLQHAVRSVGTYGDIYRRNLQEFIPRSSRNEVNRIPNLGPQHYPFPGIPVA